MEKTIMIVKSIIRKSNNIYAGWKYSRKVSKGELVTLTLHKGITIRLYPWGQITESLYSNSFEKTELGLTASYLKKGMNIIDIGANIGLYSILAAKLVGKSGRVWAFEPSGETYEHLLENLLLNNVDSVIPNRLALSDISNGEMLLQRSPGCGDAERYLSVYPDHPSIHHEDIDDPGDSEPVKVTNLDTYMEENFNNVRIDFIKIDAEGCEYPILRGAKKLLQSNSDALLLLECTREGCQWVGQKISDVLGFLKSLGFESFGWDNKNQRWESDLEFLATTGNVWACWNKKQLPCLK